jgi:hypothetical protein
MVHMAIASPQIDKHVPEVMLSKTEGHQLLGNGSLDMLPQQLISTQ